MTGFTLSLLTFFQFDASFKNSFLKLKKGEKRFHFIVHLSEIFKPLCIILSHQTCQVTLI